jgi:hypothetical protein
MSNTSIVTAPVTPALEDAQPLENGLNVYKAWHWPCRHSRPPYSTQYAPNLPPDGELKKNLNKCCHQCQGRQAVQKEHSATMHFLHSEQAELTKSLFHPKGTGFDAEKWVYNTANSGNASNAWPRLAKHS